MRGLQISISSAIVLTFVICVAELKFVEGNFWAKTSARLYTGFLSKSQIYALENILNFYNNFIKLWI